MKLLSICIPTYNRNEELKYLYQNFIAKLNEQYNNDIEIIICDNSDKNIAVLNENIFSKDIRYMKNKENIGFAKNVLKCYAEAKAEFIWILPDNDEILYDNFVGMFEYLKQNRKNLDGILIPFQSKTIFDKVNVSKLPQIKNINQLFEKNIVPFILLSSALVRKDMKYYDDIEDKLSTNDFVQIALFSMALKDSNKIYNYDKTVIDYAVEYHGRFNPFKTYSSMHIVMDYLSKYFPINVRTIDLKEFKSLINSTLADDLGAYRVYEVETVREKVQIEYKKYSNFKVSLLMILFRMPKYLRKIFYRQYFIFISMENKLSIKMYLKLSKKLDKQIEKMR